MKTVYDWKFYCTEPTCCEVTLYDIDLGEDIYKGYLSSVPNEFLDYHVASFDPVSPIDSDILVLNVSKE